jgi:1-deoxy-D-xylulose-5-phosphate reductoisomerase
MVEMVDGSLICQIGVADMRGPIQYALSYPERFAGPVPPIDLTHPHTMEFFPVDHGRFPSLRLAYEALEGGGTLPAALNAANEVAVQAFLDRRLRLTGIPKVVGRVMRRHRPQAADSMDAILDADRRARTEAGDLIARAEGV